MGIIHAGQRNGAFRIRRPYPRSTARPMAGTRARREVRSWMKPWRGAPRATCWLGPRPTAWTRCWSRRYGKSPEQCASITSALASPSRLRRRKTGGGRASSHADAQIAASLLAFSPIRSTGHGCSRRPKRPAAIWRRRSGKRDATWTSGPIAGGRLRASSAQRTRPAMIGERSSAARTLQISSNSRNADRMRRAMLRTTAA
jgi:hypothetical protein